MSLYLLLQNFAPGTDSEVFTKDNVRISSLGQVLLSLEDISTFFVIIEIKIALNWVVVCMKNFTQVLRMKDLFFIFVTPNLFQIRPVEVSRWCLSILMLSISQNPILRKVSELFRFLLFFLLIWEFQMVSAVISSYPIVHDDLLISAFLDFYSNPHLKDRKEVPSLFFSFFSFTKSYDFSLFRFLQFFQKFLN